MVQRIKGGFDGSGLSVGIVVAEFNDFITSRLITGAIDALEKCGVKNGDITVYQVPGSFEIPAVARKVRDQGDKDGIICLGAVIRGETAHFDYVCSEVTRGVGQLSFESEIPVVYGIITADTVEQAVDRAGTKAGNKGAEAAQSLVQMVGVYRSI
ncbi:MAG: 6,7-dimethyl-8-ribityllumazine synthase [bacterium]